MSSNITIYTSLSKLIKVALTKFKKEFSEVLLSDLYLMLDKEDKLLVFDDEEHLLASAQFDFFDEELTVEQIEELKKAAKQCYDEKLFEGVNLMDPFSILLVDVDFEIQEELFTVDNNQFILPSTVWDDCEKDLDAFWGKICDDFE